MRAGLGQGHNQSNRLSAIWRGNSGKNLMAFARRARRVISKRWSGILAMLVALALILPFGAPLSAAPGRESHPSVKPSARHSEANAKSASRKPQDLIAQATEVEAARVNHAPVLNGSVQGSVRQLSGENVSLSGNTTISAALIVPGTPQVVVHGHPSFGGTIQGTGSAQPSNYTVTLNGNVTLGNLVDRVDPVPMPTVPGPTTPSGTKDVSVNNQNQIPADFSNVRDLTLNGNVTGVAVPPGAYRNFSANGNCSFTFGVQGSAQPSTYSLSSLSLNGNSSFQIAGPVVLNLGSSLTMNGHGGSPNDPLALTINIASGGVTLNGGVSLYAIVQAPAGQVTLNGNSLLQGAVACDKLTINGNSTLKGTPGALLSASPTAGAQGQSLAVTLQGDNTHWLNGQTVASFGNGISVGGAAAGGAGPINVESPNSATANILISPTAALAPRTVTVTTPVAGFSGGESEVLINGFTVTAVTAPGAASSSVSTIAGLGGTPGFADGAGSAARFNGLAGLAVGPDGTIYVADSGNNRIRQVQNQSGSWVATTLAGSGTAGFADGPAASAEFNNPEGVAVDGSGNVYVADAGNNRIRKIAGGAVSTLAGNGTAGLANGADAQSEFSAPQGIAVDNQGDVYVADTGNSTVRFISITTGQVSSVAGDGTIGSNDSPSAHFNGLIGISFDGQTAFIYLADTQNERIRRLDPNGTVITLAGADQGFADGSAAQARFAEPAGIAVDGAGKLIVADSTNSLIREVDPTQVASGGNQAVFTLAGTGARALADGAGNIASFFTPAGVAVAPSSAVIVADTGNQVLRQILLPPIIDSFSPAQGQAGGTVTIFGERFDGRAPADNTVSFTQTGGGLVQAQVTAATRSQLTVTVPNGAATGPITVQTQGGTATSATNFTVAGGPPTISDFNPKSGDVGTNVVITGASLQSNQGPTTVSFVGAAGPLQAFVSFASLGEVHATVPNGAMTGPITLTTPAGSTTTAVPFMVVPSADYQITLSPSQATAIQGGTATYIVSVTSTSANFSQLVSLSSAGLPAGVNASFSPDQITAGATSTLTLDTSNASLATGNYGFNVDGLGLASGTQRAHSASAALNVAASGTTTLSGRVLSANDDTPIPGATVSLDGQTSTTDGAGSFLLSGINAGTARPVVIDGRTASVPNRTYPVITEPADVASGQANAMPFEFYLPSIDVQYQVTVVPNQTTVITTPRVAGVSVTIPANANLRNRDGSPVTQASITPVPIDRTPTPLPSNVGPSIVFTSQPGGALSDVPMPAVYPNLGGLDPGTQMSLYYFNHDTVQWQVYGTGHVSADGRTVTPDTDPSTGEPFGLPNFSWWFAASAAPTSTAAPGGNPGYCDAGCPCAQTAKTVDMSTGVKIERMTDLQFGGARGGLEFTRIYTSDLAFPGTSGPLGRGWTHNYGIHLSGTFTAGGAGRLVMPAELTGQLFSFSGTDTSDGSLLFTSTARVGYLGDVIRKLTDGTFQYRSKTGDVMRFDGNGNLTATVDRNGNTTTLSYTSGNLTSVTDPVGRSLVFAYDSSNRMTSVTDPLNRTWTYTYEGTFGVSGPPGLTSVTNPLGAKMQYAYQSGGLLIGVFDYNGTLAKTIGYDANGRVINEGYPGGGADAFGYVLSGTVVTSTNRTDPEGRVTTMRFDASGYVLESTDGLGQKTTIQRSIGPSLPLSVVGPCGCTQVTSTYDPKGNVLTQTDTLGNTERFQYDGFFNNITQRTDKLGRVSVFGYDGNGNLTSLTDPLGQTRVLAYDTFGEIMSATDALGHTTRFEYDPSGDRTAQVDALGDRTTFEYDGIGRRTATNDPLGRRTTITYNALSQVTAATDQAGATSTFAYDANGNQTAVVGALAQQQWTARYDAKNRLVSRTTPLGQTSVISYNRDDEVVALISPSGRVTNYAYDMRGQIKSIEDPLLGTTSLAYDNQKNIVMITDQRGANTTFSYDQLFRPAGKTDPLGRTSTMTYDAVGNGITAVDRLGRQTTMSYDSANRIVMAAYSDATVSYSYDSASRLTHLSDSQAGDIDRAYDDADRVLSESTDAGVVSYSYNAAGQRSSMTVAGRPAVNYGYDSAGRLQSISQGAETFTYAYDVLSRRTGLQRPNGVNTSYGYDLVNRVTRLTHTGPQGQPIEDYTLNYNTDDQLESLASLTSPTQLPQGASGAPADGANRVEQFGASTLGFDAEGQTVSRVNGQGTTLYNWDARGRLTQVVLPGGSTVSYGYDALGRRKTRTSNGVTTTFVYDDMDVVLDKGSDGSTTDYLNGGGIDEKLRQSTRGTNPMYFLQDQIGTTIALTDVNGSVVERNQHEPFGQSAGSLLTRYGYAGRERDEATGLMLYRARWYDPTQARFLSEDPMGFAAGMNLYAYVNDDPFDLVDPFGLQAHGNGRCVGLGALVDPTDHRSEEQATNDTAAFLSRAKKCGGAKNTAQFDSGQTIISVLEDLSKEGPIDQINFQDHGSPSGIIGADDQNRGLYIGNPKNPSYNPGINVNGGAATAEDLATAILNGSINIAQNGRITFFGCNSDGIASHLEWILNAGGRGDISVTGATGNVSEKDERAYVWNGYWNTYEHGSWVYNSGKYRSYR